MHQFLAELFPVAISFSNSSLSCSLSLTMYFFMELPPWLFLPSIPLAFSPVNFLLIEHYASDAQRTEKETVLQRTGLASRI